jgi:hypothetical protein
MIDSGSTHLFINPLTVTTLDLSITTSTDNDFHYLVSREFVTTLDLSIITASGNKLSTDKLCANLEFSVAKQQVCQ